MKAILKMVFSLVAGVLLVMFMTACPKDYSPEVNPAGKTAPPKPTESAQPAPGGTSSPTTPSATSTGGEEEEDEEAIPGEE